MDYYTTLNVSKKATSAEIKKAYRSLAKIHHPDKSGGDDHKFKEIQEAYETLGTAEKRKLYDRGTQQIPQFRQHLPQMVFNVVLTMKNIMDGVFHTVRFVRKTLCEVCDGHGSKSGKSYKCDSCDGKGMIVSIAQRGPFRQMVHRPCGTCQATGLSKIPKNDVCKNCLGQVTVNEKFKKEVKIPPGVRDGMQLNIGPEGNQDKSGQRRDVILKITIKKDPHFQLSGNNLVMSMPISLKESLFGFEKTFSHISGKQYSISAGSVNPIRHGDIRLISGLGPPNFESKTRGYLAVKFIVIYPMGKELMDLKEAFKDPVVNDAPKTDAPAPEFVIMVDPKSVPQAARFVRGSQKNYANFPQNGSCPVQ